MSIRLMTLAWDLRIPPSAKIVLLALCDWANDDGLCFPSVARVSARASLSSRQCKRVLHQLIDDRWVSVAANFTGGASSRRYKINVEALRSGDVRGTGAVMSPVSQLSPQGVTSVTRTGVARVTRTTKQPSIEPPLSRSPTDLGLTLPRQLSAPEQVVVANLIQDLDQELSQALLDELDGQMIAGKIRTTAVNFLHGLVKRARIGGFTPTYGPAIAARRAREEIEILSKAAGKQRSVAITPEQQAARLSEVQQVLRGSF